MRFKGFVSSIYLYFFIVLTSYIAIELENIIQLLKTVEMLNLIYEQLPTLNQAKSDIACAVFNHEESYWIELNGISIVGENDFDSQIGNATMSGIDHIDVEYSFDFEHLKIIFTQIDD